MPISARERYGTQSTRYSTKARGLVASVWIRPVVSGLLPIPREKDLDRLRALFGCTPYLGRRALFYARLVRRLLNPEFLRYFSPLDALESVGQEIRSADIGALTPTNMDRFLALKYDLPAYILTSSRPGGNGTFHRGPRAVPRQQCRRIRDRARR